MSATEDDTELRDLLIQNLENSGVLNKLKAEMRAAVFLAMDEQDKVENKTPLVNENLKKCLDTKDGRLVASLIIDFLQVFHLDFTLAVFQPEINSLNGLDSREQVSCELDITETDMNRNTPLLLELVKRGRHKEKASIFSEELSPRQIADARKKFDVYDKARTGGILKEDLKVVFGDVFPNFNKNMLEKFVTDEHRVGDKASGKSIDFQEFLGLYKRFFSQCRSVVTHDTCDVIHNPSQFIEEKKSTSPPSKDEEIPRFKGHRHSAQAEKADTKGVEVSHSHSDTSLRFGSLKGKGPGHVTPRHSEVSGDNDNGHTASLKKGLDLEVEEDLDEDDSFFDDPLPKPQKTYGCSSLPLAKSNSGASLSEKRNGEKDFVRSLREEGLSGRSFNPMRRGTSLNDLSALGSDTEGDGDELFSDYDNKRSCLEHRRAADSDPPPQRSAAGGGFHSGEARHRDLSGSKNGTSSNPRNKGFKDLKMINDKTGSSVQDDDYGDDFNSSHRSDISKSEVSIGEEIEEVSIEGPDNSDKFDEITQDLSVSQLSQSQGADYMEEVA
ncbi:FGFR1 oncogene partner isoform X5 [Oncorhynchus tshawytscha]|uniref:FGFR1 oncogene partner isoform X5 n=1 Tax=Oncorhynchus tshawytscha TaxID=74940 RepID=UPI000D099B8F|nr:FGFR1 oncogene partner isoform X5 [Oncorhynchus tshawytscha]